MHGTNVEKKRIFLFSVTYTLNFIFLFLKKKSFVEELISVRSLPVKYKHWNKIVTVITNLQSTLFYFFYNI